jgi:hypothetical protein
MLVHERGVVGLCVSPINQILYRERMSEGVVEAVVKGLPRGF